MNPGPGPLAVLMLFAAGVVAMGAIIVGVRQAAGHAARAIRRPDPTPGEAQDRPDELTEDPAQRDG